MSAERANRSFGIFLLALAVGLALPGIAAAQECIPSCDAEDGRYLAITDGSGLDTLTDTTLDLTVRVASGEPDFMIGFFDGETGGLWDLAGPTGSLDPPAPAQIYTVFADPETDGTCGGTGCVCPDLPVPGCDPTDEGVGNVVRVLDGEAMPDNDWVDFTIANVPVALNGAGSTYGYLVQAELGGDLDPAPVRNSFKVRTGAIFENDVTIEVFEQPFAFNASLPTFAELGIIYPGCVDVPLPVCLASLENTTYDGSFSFFIEQSQPQCEFIVWDGDLDHGSFDAADRDTDDPNLPPGLDSLPPWACVDPLSPCDAIFDGTAWVGPNPPLAGINFEGVALGICVGGSKDGEPCIKDPMEGGPGPQPFVPDCPDGGSCDVTGNPPDEFDGGAFGGLAAIFVRPGSLTYEIYAPGSGVGDPPIAVNDNPSGNREWEFFRIAVPGGGCYLDANGFPPDVDVAELPAGVYEVRVNGLDLENLNAFRFDGRAVPEPCGPCVGEVTELTLEYAGAIPDPIVRVELAGGGGVLFDEAVPIGGRLTVQGTGPDGVFGAPLDIYVDGQLEATILTDCDGAIFPGQRFGDIEIIEGVSSEGGLICDDLECIPDVGFDTDAAGAPLGAGQVIDDEYAGFGMFVSTDDPAHPAMIFNSADPTGGDDDLGTPNEDFNNGPGIGSGGEAGQPGENSRALGNVLIISEDGNSGNPDDNAGGGTLIFDFTSPVRVDLLEILDIEESGGTVTAFDENDVVIASAPIAVRGNNSYQVVNLGATGVRRLEVHFAGSGALAAIRFCVDDEPPVCEDSVVRDDFDVQSFGNNDGPNSWAGDWVEDDVAGAGPGSGNVKVTSSALRLDDYPNTGTHPSAARTVDLSGSEHARLKFMFDTSSGVDWSDAIAVEISTDGGASYTVLETITGIVGSFWGMRDIDISAYISSQTTVRFRVSNKYGGSHEYFYITHVEICGLCEPPPPPVCEPVMVKDKFMTDAFDGNDGTDDWSGPWEEFDTAGPGPSSGNVKVKYGWLWLNDYPNTGTEPRIARTVDLAGVDHATLDLTWKTWSGVDASDAVTLEISSDGGNSYSTLHVFTNIVGGHTGNESFDITQYASADTTIRLRVSNLYGGSNEWFKVEWVTIQGSCD